MVLLSIIRTSVYLELIRIYSEEIQFFLEWIFNCLPKIIKQLIPSPLTYNAISVNYHFHMYRSMDLFLDSSSTGLFTPESIPQWCPLELYSKSRDWEGWAPWSSSSSGVSCFRLLPFTLLESRVWSSTKTK